MNASAVYVAIRVSKHCLFYGEKIMDVAVFLMFTIMLLIKVRVYFYFRSPVLHPQDSPWSIQGAASVRVLWFRGSRRSATKGN